MLPVYVADRYEGFDAKPFQDLTDDELEHYIDANVAAVRDVAERAEPDVALANHLVDGPRGAGTRRGSATRSRSTAARSSTRSSRTRSASCRWRARASPAPRGVLVGSRHTAESLWAALDDPSLPERTRLGPPGVDVHAFRPRAAGEAAAGAARARRPARGRAGGGLGRRRGRRGALRALDPTRDRIVSFVGKLIVSKGVDLLLAAWPLVVAAVPDARLCVVGFGEYRDGAGAARSPRSSSGDLDDAREVAAPRPGARGRARGRARPTSPRSSTASTGDERERWLAAAPGAAARVHFTGRLEHSDLPDLLPACEAQVVPSTFPEAFGMVAVEAAACGALPLSAAHSGLAEVTATLREAVDEDLRAAARVRARAGRRARDRRRSSWRWLTLDDGRRRERPPPSLSRAGARALRLGERRRGRDRRRARGELAGLPRPGRSSVRAVLIGFPGLRRWPTSPLLLVSPSPASLALAACGREDEPDLVNGKKLFIGEGTCGSCHALARAGTKGTQGPDLDDGVRAGAPRRDERGDGRGRRAAADRASAPQAASCPPDLVTGDDARDVAAYVAEAAGEPGEDTGALAEVGVKRAARRPPRTECSRSTPTRPARSRSPPATATAPARASSSS